MESVRSLEQSGKAIPDEDLKSGELLIGKLVILTEHRNPIIEREFMMKKQSRVVSVLTAMVLAAVTMLFTPVDVVRAGESNQEKLTSVNNDLRATAEYVMEYEKSELELYGVTTYNDYLYAYLSMRSGAVDNVVKETLDTYLESNLPSMDDTFLNQYGSTGVKSYTLSIVMLYLAEEGQDLTNYQGMNLLNTFSNTFLAETDKNPYIYQYVTELMSVADSYDWTAVETAMKAEVLALYQNDSDGVGINYWGVTVDNNGMVLPALAAYYETDSDVKTKIDAALEWNKTNQDETGAIVAWGAGSADSTALALRASSVYGQMTDAAVYYAALEQFKDVAADGAYTYGGYASIYSTVDALIGLDAYQAALTELVNAETDGADSETGTTPDQSQDQTTDQGQTGVAGSTEQETTDETEGATTTTEVADTTDTAAATVTADTDSTDSPETADHNSVGGYLLVMISAMAVIALIEKKYKYECNETINQ